MSSVEKPFVLGVWTEKNGSGFPNVEICCLISMLEGWIMEKKNMRKMAPSSSSNIIQVSWSPDIPYWFENVLLTLLFSFKSCFASKHFCRLVVMNLQRITTWLGSFLSALRSLSAFLSILFWFLVSTHINLVSSIMNLLYATCLAPNSWWTKLATS